MAAYSKANRAMFWRIIRRLLGANRGRLFVILLALGAGAAVTAALLNLQLDAKRRLTAEFRSFGANLLVTPRDSGGALDSVKTIAQSALGQIPEKNDYGMIARVAFLYTIADVAPFEPQQQPIQLLEISVNALLGLLRGLLQALGHAVPFQRDHF